MAIRMKHYAGVLTRRADAVIGSDAWDRVGRLVDERTNGFTDHRRLGRLLDAAVAVAGRNKFTEADFVKAFSRC